MGISIVGVEFQCLPEMGKASSVRPVLQQNTEVVVGFGLSGLISNAFRK